MHKNHIVVEWGRHFAAKFDLSTQQKILDLGCRQGHLSSFLAYQYPQQHFIAVDNLASEIEQAKNLRLPNLSFQVENGLNLSFAEEFDAIVSFNCLLWIQDKLKTLQHLYYALKPGGKAYLQFFISHPYPKNDRFYYQTASMSHWQYYFKNYQSDYYEISMFEFCRLLSQVGFTIQRLEHVAYPAQFENSDHLQQWVKSWVTHHKYVPLKKQEHFLHEAVNNYFQFHRYSPKDPFTYNEYLLEVICEKPIPVENTPTQSRYRYANIIFSKREAEILKQYLLGKSAKEIAIKTTITAKTVEFHLANIKEKLNCYKRSDIFQAALRHGFINLIFDSKV
ncbi:MAG: methyltransferase domain-containing protein [Candidatus Berkiellales bacterium]